jgi:Zn-dependent protease/predicted transcriptional regulator
MGKGFGIGKLFGIRIRVDWSWLLIFLLVTWNLSSAFGQLHSDWGPAMRWGMGVAASLLFFGSVLAHEMAHSLVARTRGIPVRSITLFLFGGVSNIQREPDSPGSEFWMAVVGPLTSIVIGAILVVLTTIRVGTMRNAVSNPNQVIAQLGPAFTLIAWLGSINVTLGIFNLIPGFPLDGGRILRSALWAITDNLRRATRWASWAGQGIAWLMIIAGIAMTFGLSIPFFGTGLASGLWLAFIGWFLNNASTQSYRRLVIQGILEDVPVARIMRDCPPTVSSDISIDSLVHDHVMKTDDHAFPVIDDGQLVGIVTLEDIRAVAREEWNEKRVGEIMTASDQLITISSEEDAAEALDRLRARDVRQLPVMENGQLAGCLRRRDIVKWLQLETEAV